jgi:hypothetical protein
VENIPDYVQTTGIYIDRTTGSDCHYCIINGNINASAKEVPTAGQGYGVPEQFAPNWSGG